MNHSATWAENWWDRRTVVTNGWRLQQRDSFWVPPAYTNLRWAMEPGRNNPHLSRLNPSYFYLEAIPRKKRSYDMMSSAAFDQTVGTGMILRDPRRQEDGVAYVSFLNVANDIGTIRKLFGVITEHLAGQGFHTLVGPVGISPHLGSSLLQDYWGVLPPQHTPYHPPFMPELLGDVMRPRWRSQLYYLDIPPTLPKTAPNKAHLEPFDPQRLTTDLWSLFASSFSNWADLIPPDVLETEFLLRWLSRWQLKGWLASVEGEAVGFVLLQPDLAPQLHRSRGGRTWPQRLHLWGTQRLPVQQGRILFGGVLPEWRRQGIGSQLLHQALQTAKTQGWQTLTIGPIPSTGPANKFLKTHGAEPRQTYLLYRSDL